MDADSASIEPEPADINEVHRAVGAVVAAATSLEWSLTLAVTSLARSPLTSVIIQGERGNTLVKMAERLLKRGIGSTDEDAKSGRTERLGLLSLDDTRAYMRALKEADRLFTARDELAHSLWLANVEPGVISGQRRTRSTRTGRRWTIQEIDQIRQDFANVNMDIYICEWNTSDSGMGRLDPREGDVR